MDIAAKLLGIATKKGCHSEPSSMRTIVQYEQSSGSYAQSDHVETLGAGSS